VHEAHGVGVVAGNRRAPLDGGSDPVVDRRRRQLFVAEGQRAQPDLRIGRMEAGGEPPPGSIDQIGDGGIFRTAFAADGTGEDPGMPVAGDALLARLELQRAASGFIEMAQGWLLGNRLHIQAVVCACHPEPRRRRRTPRLNPGRAEVANRPTGIQFRGPSPRFAGSG
jgi:hypothetical protein